MSLVKYLFGFVFLGIISTAIAGNNVPMLDSDDMHDIKRRNGINMTSGELMPRSYKPPTFYRNCDISEGHLLLNEQRIIELIQQCEDNGSRWLKL